MIEITLAKRTLKINEVDRLVCETLLILYNQKGIEGLKPSLVLECLGEMTVNKKEMTTRVITEVKSFHASLEEIYDSFKRLQFKEFLSMRFLSMAGLGALCKIEKIDLEKIATFCRQTEKEK